MPSTAKEIASLIEHLQFQEAAFSTGLMLLHDDDVLDLMKRKGFDHGSTVALGRKDNSYYEGIKLWDSIGYIRRGNRSNLEFLAAWISVAFSWIGDQLSANRYFDQTPTLEFFRHLRNAASHGNKFNLRNGEPRKPAHFNGFVISPLLNGQCFLFEFMSLGDLYDLLDAVKSHLRALP